jgi:hypothetical protein
MIIGLGAGLLPMFLHNHLPIDSIQVCKVKYTGSSNLVLCFLNWSLFRNVSAN